MSGHTIATGPPRFPVLVTDVDGTLVDSRQVVLPANAAALAEYRRRGGRVVVATGRTARAVAGVRDALALDGPAILYNGARVVDLHSGAVLLELPLAASPHRLDTIAGSLDRHVVAIGFGAERAVRLSRPSPEADVTLADYEAKDGISVERPAGNRAPAISPLLKLLFIAPLALVDGLARRLAEVFVGDRVIRSEATYIEVLADGVSKGAALSWLLDEWGVDRRDVVSVGDHLNDRELLAVAGVGVAVGDGHPDLRAMADVVVGRHDAAAVADAVAIAIHGVHEGLRATEDARHLPLRVDRSEVEHG
jgi:Cof subfamily protein (haloacid dehalogenase superfamily)